MCTETEKAKMGELSLSTAVYFVFSVFYPVDTQDHGQDDKKIKPLHNHNILNCLHFSPAS